MADLCASFPAFASITGMLGLALKRGVLNTREVRVVADQLLERRRRHASFNTTDASPRSSEAHVGWMVDLNLAMKDWEAARGTTLARQFNNTFHSSPAMKP